MKYDYKQTLVEMADGSLVEQDTLNIVEKIREYDPNLRIKYCDPDRAEIGDAPYRLTELCKDGFERVVFYIWELDERVVQRLYAADTMRNQNVLQRLDAANQLAQRENNRRYEEKMDEATDLVEHYLNSPKGRYSFKNDEGQKVTIDDQPGRDYKVEE